MEWYKKTLCMASLILSLPRNENEKLDTPPLTLAPGRVAYNTITNHEFEMAWYSNHL